MTAAEATRLAQSDPVPNMTEQVGQLTADLRSTIAGLTSQLRALDTRIETLREQHDITVSVDLGPIGNAAAAARRDLERERDTPTFRMPEAR